jgi:hypothetical protein
MGGMCIEITGIELKQAQEGIVEIRCECFNEPVYFTGEFKVRWVSDAERKASFTFGVEFTFLDSSNFNTLARIILNQLQEAEVKVQERALLRT